MTSKPRPIAAIMDDFDEFGGDQIVWEDLNGALLFVQPTSIEKGINTQHGQRDAVYANIAVLDGEHGGDKYRDALVFPATLVGQLKRSTMGKMILGRLVQGEAKIDPETGEQAVNPATGEPYNKPWKFDKPTDADKTEARAYLAAQRQANRPKAV
jgi:hypothetical protein